MVVAGGVEGRIGAVPIASFSMMRAMSQRNDEPARASRPFDRDRDGFVFGEAGALLLLESEEYAEEHAAPRSAGEYWVRASPPMRTTSWRPHRTVKAPLARCARRSVPPDCRHRTSRTSTRTPRRLPSATRPRRRRSLRSLGTRTVVHAPKSALGHSIGAVGALEAILTILTLENQVVPPTLNLDNEDPAIELDIVSGAPRQQRIDYALSNSIGFGGHNVSLAFGRG